MIEMIVSVGVFAIVVTTAVGAFLVVLATNKQLQDEQNVMTNLSFAVDSMTRELRTGSAYVCDSQDSRSGGMKMFALTGSDKNRHDALGTSTVQDCLGDSDDNFHGVSFIEGGNSITGSSDRILYYFDQEDSNDKKLLRRVGNNDPQSILPSNIELIDVNFAVTGTDIQKVTGNSEQPTVTIYMEARAKDDPNAKIYGLQTSVTQRILDL